MSDTVWRIEKHRQAGFPVPYHSEMEWVRYWVEYDKDDELIQIHGCVCHTPGPFDHNSRQPRLMPYCTSERCTNTAVYSVKPLGRPAEYACYEHLFDLTRCFPDRLVWSDIRDNPSQEPLWFPWFPGEIKLEKGRG